MRALSLLQPWAWLIVQPDPERPQYPLKDVENRVWRLPRNFIIPQRIYVHASLTWKESAFPGLQQIIKDEGIQIPSRTELAFGAIIGEVTIMDDTQESNSDWADGNDHWAFNLKYPMVYETPIPCKGHLGFWKPPEDIMEPSYKVTDFDECECGDYYSDHDSKTGMCRMPDNRSHGFRLCYKFKLSHFARGIPAAFRSRL